MSQEAREVTLPRRTHDWPALLITAVGTFFSTYVALQTGIFTAEVDQLNLAYQRIEKLERKVSELTMQVTDLSVENSILKLKIETGTNPFTPIYGFLEGLSVPAWVQVEEGSGFRMLNANSAYERMYARDGEPYVGRWVEDVFPHTTEEDHKVNLTVVYRRAFTPTQLAMPDGQRAEVWKFYYKLPDGRAAIVGIRLRPSTSG